MVDATLADLVPGQLTLERLLDDASLVNFRMSVVQRAMVRAAGGMPVGDILSEDKKKYHFGGVHLPDIRPRTVIPRTGVRAGKTYISACAMIDSMLTCSLRHVPTKEELDGGVLPDSDGMTGVRPGEQIKCLIVTPRAHQGKQAFGYIVGALNASQRLKKLIVHSTLETITIRRPCDGKEIRVEMVAASPRGNNLRGFWLAGVLFDEAAFWGDDDAAVNLRDNVGAAVTRLLPGAQCWMPSSPWADSGLYHELFEKAFSPKLRDSDTLAFHSDSRALNPALDRKLESDARAEDPQNAAREYDAIPLSSLSNLFFPPPAIVLCTDMSRTAENGNLTLEPYPGVPHFAGSDLGFRKNSSTLAICRVRLDPIIELAYYEEWIPQPGTPLKASVVVHSFGASCQQYGCDELRGDNAYLHDALEHLESLPGPAVSYDSYNPTQTENAAMFTQFRTLLCEGRINMPNDPRLLGQLKKVLGKPIAGGRMQIMLPKQGAAHGDLVVAFVHAAVMAANGAKRQAGWDHRWDASTRGNSDGWDDRDDDAGMLRRAAQSADPGRAGY
jgi:hypothetical protein